MLLILCASKHHILDHWIHHITPGAYQIAKSQKALLEQLTEAMEVPIVLLEARLYEETLSEIIQLMREANPATAVLILSHVPTFHGGQEALGAGANGYGNLYLARGWLQDALKAIAQDENWLFPLQESEQTEAACVGKLTEVQDIVTREGDFLTPDTPLYAHDILTLPNPSSRAVVALDQGMQLVLKGEETLYLDQSVYAKDPNEILPTPVLASAHKRPHTPLPNRPFYVNVGSKSLIDASSSELALAPQASAYISVCPFRIEEKSNDEAEARLTFGEEAPPPCPSGPNTMKFQGKIEEYEIIHSNVLAGCVLVNDTLEERDGATIVYAPMQVLAFANAKVDLSHARQPAVPLGKKQLGDLVAWEHVTDAKLTGVNVTLSDYVQGVDYVLFDRALIPPQVRFNYAMDAQHISINFLGEASLEAYHTLLQSLKHESSDTRNRTLHVKISTTSTDAQWTLLDAPIDTSGNTF